ncbi:MAG: YlxR family protein [Firmicutes bacterium]|nr:YlxR family protein [Bacillota bacterium]
MANKKIPLRKCVGCGERVPKKELIRVVKNKKGEIKIDITGKANGRGAYICNDKKCFEKAKKSRRLNNALKTEIPDEIYERLLKEVINNG